DDFCDPLELKPDSFLGVAGLVEAVRAGEVAVVNPLGSGAAQSGALLPFLPSICRRLLGEDLALASVPTVWCGDPRSMEYVESALERLVVKPAFPSGPTDPVFAGDLSREARAGLLDRMRAAPSHFIAQERVEMSIAPSLSADELAAKHFWMRTYAVVSPGGYEVMPGALARVGRVGAVGGESKDTWVIASGPVQALSLLPPPSAPVEITHDESDLPSRIADNLFWLGRYVERAEGTARLLRTLAGRMVEQSAIVDPEVAADIDPLVRMLETQTYVRRGFDLPTRGDGGGGRNGEGRNARHENGEAPAWPREVQRWLVASVFDAHPTGTLRATVAETHRIARTLRDWLSLDAWRAAANLDQELRRPITPAEPSALRALLDLLNRAVTLLAALGGLVSESMTHDQAWRFLDIGRRLERASHVVGLLRSSLDPPSPREGPVLEALLDVTASSTTYRRRYLANLQVCPVVDLLLCDETNPRSALFQLEALKAHLFHLPNLPRSSSSSRSPQQRLVLGMLTELQIADVADLCQASERADADGDRRPLMALLDRVRFQLPALSNSVSAAYFNHAVFTA
ncbi:MAG TPA: circularly permuted type 2 ATP-grasp protein, partial [Polyangiaceae bacterium]|nr:circularly permuted type 2 ATP-grasp protein [Polyangiaceae bacterium]